MNRPAYRATVYAPYSVDATETTILTPYTPVSGGAIHGDQFKVCSVPSIAGSTWRPYLDIPDNGRHGKLDPLTRNIDKGQFTLRLLDPRTSPGGSNLTRWMSAFIGDGNGAGLMNGRKVFVEESLDFDQTTGVGTWAAYATGRITKLSIDRSRQWFALEVQDMSTDLDDMLFRGIPRNLDVVPSGTAANCATTAQGPSIVPLGLSRAWGGQSSVGQMTGAVNSATGTTAAEIFASEGEWSARRAMLVAETNALVYPQDGSSAVRVDMTWNSGANRGTFLFMGYSRQLVNYGLGDGVYHDWLRSFGITVLTASDWGYTAAVPTAGTAVTYRVYPTRWTITEQMPILVADTHPVTLIRWILDGYFGDLKLDGTARRAFPRYNPTGAAGDPFYDLEQDASFGRARGVFTEQMKRRDVLKALCLQFGLALDLDASGKMTITDVRSRAAALGGALPALTNADAIATDPARWTHARDGAVSRIDCTYYGDTLITADEVASMDDTHPDACPLLVQVDTEGRPLEELNVTERALDANGKPITIDCTFFRGVAPNEISAPDTAAAVRSDRETQIRAQIATVQEEFRRLFGTGPMTAEIPCRRTSVVASIRPGNYATVTVDELPDPTTNRRGGTRLMLCTGREERGLSVVLSFLDCGRNAVASAPSISAVLNAADGAHAIDVTATLSADGGAVVEYAVTTTSVAVRPGDSDARWTRGFRADANGTTTIDSLPSGRRVWLRCSTRPLASKGFSRPSSYAYLGGTGYLDLSAIAGPTAGATSGTIYKSAVTLTWTNGNTDDVVDVFLIQSASAPADWTETYRVATLPPGSTRYDLGKLTAASGTSYTWLARCRDTEGGVSAGTGTTFVSGATTITAPTPGALVVTNAGASTYSLKDADVTKGKGFGVHRFGVELLSVPVDASYDREIQRAPDSAGSPGTFATIATLRGAQTLYVDALPYTGATYWYRQRHTGLGADPSSYSDAVSATSKPLIASLQFDEGRRLTDTVVASDATLNPDVGSQRDTGSAQKTFMVKGLRSGTCRHGDAVTFSPAFKGTPIVWFGDSRSDQSGAKWANSVGGVPGVLARTAGVDPYQVKKALSLTASGFTAQLLLRQKGTSTTRLSDGSGVAMTAAGHTDASAALANAPSATSQYTIRGRGSITARSFFLGSPVTLDVIVAVEARVSNVAAYSEVWRTPSPYSVSDDTQTTQTLSISLSALVTVASMTSTGDFRLKIISSTKTGSGVTSLSLRGDVVASDGAGNAMVIYYTATGEQYASLTPDADDAVEWFAQEGS